MINYMASRRVPSAITEPLFANVAHHNAMGLMDAAVFASKVRQFAVVVEFFVLLFKLQFSKNLGCCYNFTNVVIHLKGILDCM